MSFCFLTLHPSFCLSASASAPQPLPICPCLSANISNSGIAPLPLQSASVSVPLPLPLSSAPLPLCLFLCLCPSASVSAPLPLPLCPSPSASVSTCLPLTQGKQAITEAQFLHCFNFQAVGPSRCSWILGRAAGSRRDMPSVSCQEHIVYLPGWHHFPTVYLCQS